MVTGWGAEENARAVLGCKCYDLVRKYEVIAYESEMRDYQNRVWISVIINIAPFGKRSHFL